MTDTKTKRCTKCGKVRAICEFSEHMGFSDWLNTSCKQCVAEYQRGYYQKNYYTIFNRKHKHRVRNQKIYTERSNRYRAQRKTANGINYTTAEHIAARCEMWGNKCYICGAPMEAIDHVKPIARGGAHLPCNLRPICTSCNTRKNAKWPFDIEKLRELAFSPTSDTA